ncbi:MAG: dihydropteroate synthase [Flavobacteriales bacterium]
MIFSDVQVSTFYNNFTLNCRGKIVDLSTPLVMGIINCTPDSFHADSRVESTEKAVILAQKHISEGAAILDIGAYSSRPGAENISTEEEINRLLPVVEAIRKQFPDVLISIDSFRTEVIEKVLPLGIDMVNDISGLADENILKIIKGKNIAYILMHTQGTPQNMQDAPSYKSVNTEVFSFFKEKIEIIRKHGVKDIIIDPGFGFGKTIEHNFDLFKNIHFFKSLNTPILIGISRKSMIYKTLNCTAAEALNGTTALHAIALQKGGNMLRVHDVKEAVEVIKLHSKYSSNEC